MGARRSKPLGEEGNDEMNLTDIPHRSRENGHTVGGINAAKTDGIPSLWPELDVKRLSPRRIEDVYHTLDSGGGGGEAGSLPCLYSNNGIEEDESTLNLLQPYHRKQAEVLSVNTREFVDMVGLQNVGFLTLTFRDNLRDSKKAQKRFKSLSTNYLSFKFGHWMLVKERQKRGAWHYHLLVDCKTDIRTGVDFGEFRLGVYTSASRELRSFWFDLRKELPKYRFGRSELVPIRSNHEAIARYVGKYISKHVGERREEDKGVRLFSSSGKFHCANVRFSWSTVGGWIWREKLKTFANHFGCYRFEDLTESFGDNWAYKLQDQILETALPADVVYPTVDHWRAYNMVSEEFQPPGWFEGETNFMLNYR